MAMQNPWLSSVHKRRRQLRRAAVPRDSDSTLRVRLRVCVQQLIKLLCVILPPAKSATEINSGERMCSFSSRMPDPA